MRIVTGRAGYTLGILGIAAALGACSGGEPPPSAGTSALSAAPVTVALDSDDIGGVVTSSAGPEAGVWVIAETEDFDTRFARIVVTDDQGRYLVPDLPAASYELWVRGYGLADSPRVEAAPGELVDLAAIVAPDAATAAKAYPAAAWYSMVHLPSESELANVPGGLNHYLARMKNLGCVGCHQLGQLATRTIPPAFRVRDRRSSLDAPHAIGPGRRADGRHGGPAGRHAVQVSRRLDRPVAAGELPSWTPPRPAGLERNVVATVRDWANREAYLHDLTATDRRNPTVNGYGELYGSPELSTDEFPILDPVANTATTFTPPVRDADTASTHEYPVTQPSAYWGDERIWDSQANTHNPMMDQQGRVWYTARMRRTTRTRPSARQGSDHPSAKLLSELESSGRQLAVYDPDHGQIHVRRHLLLDPPSAVRRGREQHAMDAAAAAREVIGWLNTKLFDETGDARRRARLDARWCSTPTATASATPTSARTSRSIPTQRQAHQRGLLRRDAEPRRRLGLGLLRAASRAPSSGSIRATIRPPRRWPKSTTCRCRASASAAPTSTATASSGSRSAAAISASSTAASAKGR